MHEAQGVHHAAAGVHGQDEGTQPDSHDGHGHGGQLGLARRVVTAAGKRREDERPRAHSRQEQVDGDNSIPNHYCLPS